MGENTLHLFVRNLDIVKKYHVHGTPLHWAARNGNLDICQLILEKVKNKNPAIAVGCQSGWTPLHFAARYGHIDICRLIIANVDDKHPINDDGETPMDIADRRNHVDIYKLFDNSGQVELVGQVGRQLPYHFLCTLI